MELGHPGALGARGAAAAGERPDPQTRQQHQRADQEQQHEVRAGEGEGVAAALGVIRRRLAARVVREVDPAVAVVVDPVRALGGAATAAAASAAGVPAISASSSMPTCSLVTGSVGRTRIVKCGWAPTLVTLSTCGPGMSWPSIVKPYSNIVTVAPAVGSSAAVGVAASPVTVISTGACGEKGSPAQVT